MADEEEMALAALALAKVKERFGPEGGSAPAQSGDKFCFVEYGEEALAPDEEEREAKREAAISAAKRENLTLVVAENSGGYFGVYLQPGRRPSYRAALKHGGNKLVYLGTFATAEEAALCVARSPEGNKKAAAARTREGKKKAAPKAAAGRPPADEEEREARREAAISAARSEKLTLLVAATTGGYFGVSLTHAKYKPYEARVWRGGRAANLGYFVTAEEAALCVARTPEGEKTATRRAKKRQRR
jgi:hypothetical protein